MSPLYYHKSFMVDLKEKAEHLTRSSLHNAPSFQIIVVQFLVTLIMLLKTLSTVALSVKDIGKIIQNRDSNKAHTHDDIIIRIPGVFPSELKKTNIVPVQKKIDQQNIKNYRPAVYLLPICDKIFEKIIFNEMFRFLSLIILFHQ